MKKDGIKWVDPHYKEYWKYVLALAKECYAAGFDEVQFDYIRFPGSRAPLVFPHGPNNGKINRSELITKFARYLKKNLSDLNKPTSFDVFGLVGNLHNNDLGIGQEWHKLSPYTNYMSPMMYPSHYPNGFAGIRTPDLRPYSIIAQSVARSIRANNNSKKPTNIRPWIQAFTAKWLKHHIPYGKNELNQQIKALKDKGIKSYLLWHPGSKFNLFYREVFNQKKKIVKENLEAEDLEANPEEEDILSSHN